MKVFELAKELDCKALELIDKIKPLDLEVKNHMSDLSAEQVEKIKDFLTPSVSEKSTKKKKVVRKKKAAKKKSTVIRRTVKKSEASKEPVVPAEALKSEAADSSTSSLDVQANEVVESTEALPEKSVQPQNKEIQASVVSEKALPSSEGPEEEKEQKPSVEAQETVEVKKPRKLKSTKYNVIKVAKEDVERVRKPLIVEEDSSAPVVEEMPMDLEDESPMKKLRTDDDDNHAQRSAAEILKEIEKEEAAQKKRSSFGQRSAQYAQNFRSTDYLRRERVYNSRKKKLASARGSYGKKVSSSNTVESKNKYIDFERRISVENLADQLSTKVKTVAYKLDQLGLERDPGVHGFSDWYLDLEAAQLIAAEFGHEVRDRTVYENDLLSAKDAKESSESDLSPRAPVITIMGHVDHGKTSLLDLIRRSRVAVKEAGGITQHIGAYTVSVEEAIQNLATDEEKKALKKQKKKDKKSGKKSGVKKSGQQLSFLDTPGHAAFSSMRSRGAQCTDIVVLVVAATDGLMPQTREAIDHSKAAGVPIIVAINKMDLPEANPDKVIQQLSEMGIMSEDWGGDTLFAKVSAKTGEGVADLLEKIQLQAELLELKARSEGAAQGVIVEARLDKGKGPLATVLVQEGLLKVGDYVVAGTETGKVRALVDDKGKNTQSAGPSTPVAILGLDSVPEAGDTLNAVESEKVAREVVEIRKQKKGVDAGRPAKMTLEELFSKMNEGQVQELPLIMKADVKGSAEAIQGSLLKLPDEKVRLKILSASVGGISESDVILANASNAIIIGFNVRPDAKSLAEAEKLGVQIKTYDVIYDLIDDVKKAMEGLLAPTIRETVLGQAEVRDVFNLSNRGTIAGSFIISGKMIRGSHVRLIRDGVVVYTGVMGGLRRFKDDVKEVQQGYECGISIENFNDIKENDVIEAFKKEEIATKLEDSPKKSDSSSQDVNP